MTMRREESDDRVVPEGRRKAAPTSTSARGGKAITASKETSQLPLFSETADSPRGAVPGEGRDRSRLLTQHAVPKSEDAYSKDSPAMTMEEVASCTVDNRGSSSPKNSSRSTWTAAGGNADAGIRD